MARRTVAGLVVLAGLLAGCGGGGKGGASAPAAKADPSQCPVKALDTATAPVAVTFWHSMSSANQDALKTLTDKYNASQSKVKVDLKFQGSYDDSVQKFVAAVRNGELPTIIQTDETAMQTMMDSQSIVPIGACVAADAYDLSDFAPSLIGQYTYNGVLQTMPFQVSNPVLYYNKKAFRAAGLDPDRPPRTFDEIIAASRAIVAAGKAKGASDKAFALQTQAWYAEQFMSMAGEAIVNNDNGRSSRATAARLDTKAFGDVLQWIATMNKEGLLLSTGRNAETNNPLLAVATQQASMTINTSASLGSIYQLLPNFPNVEVGVAPLPGPSGGGVTVGGGSLYLTNKTTDLQRAAAWDFMKFLNSPQSQATWHVGTGYIPTRLSAASLPEVQKLWTDRPGFRVAFDQLASAKKPVGGGGPVIGDYVGFRNAIEAGVESVLASGDVAKTQTKVQQDATKAIADYNRRVGG